MLSCYCQTIQVTITEVFAKADFSVVGRYFYENVLRSYWLVCWKVLLNKGSCDKNITFSKLICLLS